MSKSSAPEPNTLPGFDLSRIHLIEASFLDCLISTEIPSNGFAASVRFEVLEPLAVPSFDMAAERVYYTLSLGVESFASTGEQNGSTGFFRMHFAFQVDDIADYQEHEPDYDGAFPTPDLMIMLGGVAYATARGMLIGKTAGTPLNGFSLPLLNPQQLFYESMEKLTAETVVEEPAKKRKPAAKGAPQKRVASKRMK